MSTFRSFALPALLLAALPALADDATRTIRATLVGYNEVPPVSTVASGEFVARVTATGIEYQLTYRNLRGTTTTGAHIHFGQDDVNGGVMAHLCGGGGTAPCPAVGGTVTGTIGPAQVTGPAGQGIDAGQYEEVLAAIRAGVTYVNVHSDLHLGGEIRGQVK